MKQNSILKTSDDRFPLLYEIVPPEKGNKEERLKQHKECLDRLFDQTEVDALNLPEIQDESAKSDKGKRRMPHKERIKPRNYAMDLAERFDTEFVINRVVVKHTYEQHEQWLQETHDEFGIKNIVFVGGESSGDTYPGPSVSESNRFVKRFMNQGKLKVGDDEITPTEFTIGNICIPTRRRKDFDEPERMYHKQQAGADFFTTQIIYDHESPTSLMRDLSEILKDEEMDSPTVFWSFSPISSKKDVDFLRWLGVYIPEETEEQILESGDPVAESLTIAQSIWDEMQEVNKELSVPLNMGINISIMGLRNFDNGIAMANNLNNIKVPK